jgi:hypothetical protein
MHAVLRENRAIRRLCGDESRELRETTRRGGFISSQTQLLGTG